MDKIWAQKLFSTSEGSLVSEMKESGMNGASEQLSAQSKRISFVFVSLSTSTLKSTKITLLAVIISTAQTFGILHLHLFVVNSLLISITTPTKLYFPFLVVYRTIEKKEYFIPSMIKATHIEG